MILSTYIGMPSPASGPAVLQWGNDVVGLPPQNLTQQSGPITRLASDFDWERKKYDFTVQYNQLTSWWWWLLAVGWSTAAQWSGRWLSSPPPCHPSTKSLLSLLFIIDCIATNKADVMMAVVDATPPRLFWQPSIATLLQSHTSANNTALPPLLQMKCHCCHPFHVIVAAASPKEHWVGAMGCHHCRVGPPLSQLDGTLDLPSLSAVKSANL